MMHNIILFRAPNIDVSSIAQTPLLQFVVDMLLNKSTKKHGDTYAWERRVAALVVLITSPTPLCIVQQIDSSSDLY